MDTKYLFSSLAIKFITKRRVAVQVGVDERGGGMGGISNTVNCMA